MYRPKRTCGIRRSAVNRGDVARCRTQLTGTCKRFASSGAAARDRGKLLDSSQPVGKVLDQLIKEAQDLVVNGFKPKKKK
jgi:hypothetical protein